MEMKRIKRKGLNKKHVKVRGLNLQFSKKQMPKRRTKQQTWLY